MKRDTSIELLRTLLMFGICMIHAGNAGPYHLSPWWSIWGVSVTGFVFLTGYFGVSSFKISRILKLYVIAFYTSVLWAGVCAYGTPDWGVVMVIRNAWERMMGGCWFLHAYALLMFFAPMINAIVPGEPKSKDEAKSMILKSAPILFFSYVWAGGLIHVFRHAAPTAEFVNFPSMQFLGVYTAARLFRVLKLERFFTWWRFGFAFVILYAVIMFDPIGNKFTSTLLAALLVAVFHRINVSDGIGKIIAFLSPSLFAVYLIHTNSIGFGFIVKAQEFLIGGHGFPKVLSFTAIAIVLFFASLALDMPRRAFCYAARGCIKWICDIADRVFMWPFEKVAKTLERYSESQ